MQRVSAKTKQKYIHWRAGVAYYIRRVPKDIKDVVGADRWDTSLNTRDIQAAEFAARAKAVEHDGLIKAVRGLPEIERKKLALRFAERTYVQNLLTLNDPKTVNRLAIKLSMAGTYDRGVAATASIAEARNKAVPNGASLAQKMARDDVNADFVRDRLSLLKLAQMTTGPKEPFTVGQKLVLRVLTGNDDEGAFTKLTEQFTVRGLIDQIKADESEIAQYEQEKRAQNVLAAQLGVKRKTPLEPPDDPDNPRLLTALDMWLDREKQKHDTARKYRHYIRRLVDSVGNVPIRSLRKKDIIKYVDELTLMPNATHDTQRTLPLHELISRRNEWLAGNEVAPLVRTDFPLG